MKIGIVSQSYYPRYGGVTEHVHHTAVELRRRGHEVTIITSHFRRGEVEEPGVERIGYNLLIPFNGAFVDLAVGWRLRWQLGELFRRHRFDVVHTHAPVVPTLPLLSIQIAPCAQVGTFHTTGNPDAWLEWSCRLLEKDVGRLHERIAVSKTARKFAAHFFPGEYHVIPNGVDVTRFHPEVEPFEEHREPGVVNLLFVGRLDPRKGVHHLLAAMPGVVARSNVPVRLLLVGDSYLRHKLQASVPANLRDRVRFLGHVPSNDLPRWYATGDIFVSPASGQESFGIVLVEAMASGRAVVASDIPGYRTVVTPDRDGVVVPPGDVNALAEKIAGLVNDPVKRASIAARGRERALEFAWPHITDQLERVYESALRRHRDAQSARGR
ncbi:MAG: glycosyltransferase family 4 protein [Candidatus Eisenbacteria bacterium]|uniref:Glycosyltransferase family 4 protein n=1 Tax=Eiseniibacteriota bacterium TaxID=2212470 RepID=A0A849SBT4_UNCEI|nr:glycosyltransferase family 4 protein [Candidatus Eisenbacteria bacterium]